MSPLVVVTGPPGAGKSTVCAHLLDRLPHSVAIEGDAFFGFRRQVAYVVLLPPVGRGVERVRTRVGHGFGDEAAGRFVLR